MYILLTIFGLACMPAACKVYKAWMYEKAYQNSLRRKT